MTVSEQTNKYKKSFKDVQKIMIFFSMAINKNVIKNIKYSTSKITIEIISLIQSAHDI
jgi:hypothetical protein